MDTSPTPTLSAATIRRIIAVAKPFRLMITACVAVTVATSALGMATPLLAGQVVTAISASGPDAGAHVVRLAIAMGGLSAVSIGLSVLGVWIAARVGEGIVVTLRECLYRHVQAMPLQFFVRTHTGALLNRVEGDVYGAEQAFVSTLPAMAGNLVSLVLAGAFMIALSWQITAAALIVSSAAMLIGRRFSVGMRAVMLHTRQLDARLDTMLTERFSVGGALLATLTGHPERDLQRFSTLTDAIRTTSIRRVMMSRSFYAALTLILGLAEASTYGLGGWFSARHAVSAGTVITLALLLNKLFGPLVSVSNVRADMAGALVSFERVFELLDLEPMIVDAPDAVSLPPGPCTVEFRHVSFRYPHAAQVSIASLEDLTVLDDQPGEQVLADVSLRIGPGEMVALVGRSGSGKSTVAMLLARLYDVEDGAVFINGIDVRACSQRTLRSRVAFVTQDAHLTHDTIAANLRAADPDATDDRLWSALADAQVDEVIRELPAGLDTVVGERGFRLSGGEKQRIAIARLLLADPALVILDEATAHLDGESEAAVQRALATAMAGRSALVIAHRLSTILDADQILVLEDGRIVERGSHAELVGAHGGRYAALHEASSGRSPRPRTDMSRTDTSRARRRHMRRRNPTGRR